MTAPTLPLIVGLTGRAGSGKSTASNWIIRNHHMVSPLAFAGPLKVMTYELLRMALPKGHDPDARAYITDPVLKETPIPFLGNLTARRIMQTLGTEWGREALHQDFWIWLAAAKVERMIGSTFKKSDKVPLKIVFDDLRFANEAAMIWAYGGLIIEIVRPDAEKPADIAGHASEQLDFAADVTIVNDGTVEDLEAKMAALLPVPPKPEKKA